LSRLGGGEGVGGRSRNARGAVGGVDARIGVGERSHGLPFWFYGGDTESPLLDAAAIGYTDEAGGGFGGNSDFFVNPGLSIHFYQGRLVVYVRVVCGAAGDGRCGSRGRWVGRVRAARADGKRSSRWRVWAGSRNRLTSATFRSSRKMGRAIN
jgi:hypothetical protein